MPHGLLRYGVAPDHPEAKNAIHRLEKSVYADAQGRVRFLGGVALGSAIQAKDLSNAYHGVIFAYGASSDRSLGLKGEERGPLSGIFSSSEFVGWYNGHPSLSKASEFTFKNYFSNPNSTPKVAIIIGQGNVALDMARLLLKPLTVLRSTDMASRAIEALSHSKLQETRIVGRRGPLQASFTAKELRELTQLPNTRILIDNPRLLEEAVASLDSLKDRSHKRVLELLLKNVSSPITNKAMHNNRACALDFFQKPVELHFNEDTGRIQAVTFERTQLDKKDGRVVGTGQTFKRPCDMLLKSIGYASVPYPGLPWDSAKCIIPNNSGRILEESVCCCQLSLRSFFFKNLMCTHRQVVLDCMSPDGSREGLQAQSQRVSLTQQKPRTPFWKTGTNSSPEHLQQPLTQSSLQKRFAR